MTPTRHLPSGSAPSSSPWIRPSIHCPTASTSSRRLRLHTARVPRCCRAVTLSCAAVAALRWSVMSAAQHILDQAHSLPRIEALAAEPGVYAERLSEELPSAATLAELEARDAALAGALGRIDAM